MAAEDDECHDGGALKGESVLITLGPHRKKKGRIIGGGHNFYLIALSGREKGVVCLKYLFVLVLLFNLVSIFPTCTDVLGLNKLFSFFRY